MRTTVEFSPALMRAAKARSAERGESLKVLLIRAVTAELGGHPATAAARTRVTLPLFGAATGARVNPSSADLEQALADSDAAHASARTSRPRKRAYRR
jgi:hypothetical protein